MSDTATTAAHPLTVRVMRLSRPTLQPVPPTLIVDDESPLLLKGALAIPSTFGTVCVGETLRCCVSLANASAADVAGAALRVELHVGGGALSAATRRAVLLDAAVPDLLRCGDRADYAVSHALSEPGQHVMVCSVTYEVPGAVASSSAPPATSSSSSTTTGGFRRFFSFKVGHCVEARTRVVEAPAVGGGPRRWLVEAQVEALSNVFLESLSLDPPDACVSAPLDSNASAATVATATSTGDGFPEHLPRLRSLQQYLRAGSQLRRVFELTQQRNSAGGVALMQPGAPLGRLLVAWRGVCGEPGKLHLPVVSSSRHVHQQQAQALVPVDIRVAEPNAATEVQLLVPFTLRCVLANRSQAPLHVHITFVPDTAPGGVAQVGTRNDSATVELLPGSDHEFRCPLLPLQPGVQRLGALSVLDVRTSRELFFPDLGSVLVKAASLPKHCTA